MQKSFPISLLFVFSGILLAQEAIPEIHGPQSSRRGNLVVFETNEPADWCLTPLDRSLGKWSVDTSGKMFYFASNEPGQYTVCAAILVDGQPKILSRTFTNGDETDVQPQPVPDPDDLGAWIRSKTEEISFTKNYLTEREAIAACFQSIADGIQRGAIRTAPAARANMRMCLAPKLLACSTESRKLWTQFLDSLSEEIEKRCQNEPNDLQRLRALFGEIAEEIRNKK